MVDVATQLTSLTYNSVSMFYKLISIFLFRGMIPLSSVKKKNLVITIGDHLASQINIQYIVHGFLMEGT